VLMSSLLSSVASRDRKFTTSDIGVISVFNMIALDKFEHVGMATSTRMCTCGRMNRHWRCPEIWLLPTAALISAWCPP